MEKCDVKNLTYVYCKPCRYLVLKTEYAEDKKNIDKA